MVAPNNNKSVKFYIAPEKGLQFMSGLSFILAFYNHPKNINNTESFIAELSRKLGISRNEIRQSIDVTLEMLIQFNNDVLFGE